MQFEWHRFTYRASMGFLEYVFCFSCSRSIKQKVCPNTDFISLYSNYCSFAFDSNHLNPIFTVSISHLLTYTYFK